MIFPIRSYPPYLVSLFAGGTTIVLTLLSSFSPFLSLFLNYFNVLPLFLVSLSLGLNAGVSAATIALIGIFLAFGAYQAIGFTFISYLPFLLLSYLILKPNLSREDSDFKYPLGIIVSKVSLCVLLVSLTFFAFLYESGIDVRGSIHHFLNDMIPPELTIDKAKLVDQLVDIIPGIMMVSWIVTGLMNALVAQRILVKQQEALRSLQESDYTFENYWDIVVTAALMLIILNHFFHLPLLSLIGKTAAFLGCLPMAAVGFRICQLRFSTGRFKGVGFSILIFLTFLLVWPLLIIVLLGFIEPWYGLTQRIAEKNKPD
ncbi:MAG: YybS family protein [Alphaproteobacteria bacterium]|nr:YybS family protein [Alphaproteobacteria bacterium]